MPSTISSARRRCRHAGRVSSRRSRTSTAHWPFSASKRSSVERLRRELSVYRALGGIYAEYRGFSSEECGRAYTTALDLCRELGDTPEIFAVLSGLGSFEITRAGFDKCRALAEECLSRAAAQASKPPFIMGHLLLGGTLFLQGELADARKHLEEALLLYDADQSPRRGKQVLYVQDQKSTGLCYLALTLTIMGEVDKGVLAGETGLAHSRSLGGLAHDQFLAVLPGGGALHRRRHAGRTAVRNGVARVGPRAGLRDVDRHLAGGPRRIAGEERPGRRRTCRAQSRHGARTPECRPRAYQTFAMALWAEGLIAAERHDEALDALNRALAISETNGERFYACGVVAFEERGAGETRRRRRCRTLSARGDRGRAAATGRTCSRFAARSPWQEISPRPHVSHAGPERPSRSPVDPFRRARQPDRCERRRSRRRRASRRRSHSHGCSGRAD